MAKKEKEVPQERSMGFNEMLKTLTKQHNELSGDSAQFGEENLGSAVKLWIPTGSIALDTIISNNANYGGWPCGRITEIYGEQAYGKSSLCFQGMANCQAMGGLVIFYDIELAASEELMRGYGIDISKILYSNLSTVEEIFQSLQDNLSLIANNPQMKDKPVMVVIDSLAAMKSKKLEEGTYDYNMNTQGEFSKILGSGLKRSLEFLSAAFAALIVINQQRDKLGLIPGKTQPGGNAMKFYATLRCVLLGKEYLKEKEDISLDNVPYGAAVTVRTDKNKLGPPMRSVSMNLIFTKGIDEVNEWVDYLSRIDVTEGTTWRTITDKFPVKEYVGKKFQRGNSFLELLEEAPFYEGCVKVIKQGFVRKLDDVKLRDEQGSSAAIKE